MSRIRSPATWARLAVEGARRERVEDGPYPWYREAERASISCLEKGLAPTGLMAVGWCGSFSAEN